MNKKELTEADIRTKFITPAVLGTDNSKWNVMTQLREEVFFTKGRVIVHGKTTKRGEAKKVDYLLYYKPNLLYYKPKGSGTGWPCAHLNWRSWCAICKLVMNASSKI